MMTDAPNRKRLGLIVPSDRLGMSPDDPPFLGETGEYGRWIEEHGIDGVEVLFEASFSTGSHAPDSVWQTGDLNVLTPPACRLRDAGCDALSWPCTCASFIGGLEWSRNQVAELTRASGLPATSTSLAMLAAIETLGADTVDLLGPYPRSVTTAFQRFLNEAGIEVAAMVALDCADDGVSIRLDLLREAKRFDDGLPGRNHPLVIPDTAVYSLNVVEQVESELGRPVVAANQATVWHSLKMLDIDCHTTDTGLLFRDPTSPVPADSQGSC